MNKIYAFSFVRDKKALFPCLNSEDLMHLCLYSIYNFLCFQYESHQFK